MMNVKPVGQVASTILVMAMGPFAYASAEPAPVILVSPLQMPKEVPVQGVVELYQHEVAELDAVRLYHELRESFGVSHTVMADWLGVKRRTLYNWMNQSSKDSRYGDQIESRLYQLGMFRNEIESEHVKLVKKIAFSPIYGDPEFGVAIVKGADSSELLKWYDKLFSRFESYKSVKNKNTSLS